MCKKMIQLLKASLIFTMGLLVNWQNANAQNLSSNASKALAYIVSQQDPTTFLIRSYASEQHSYIYDDVVALVAMTGNKRKEAESLANALLKVQNADGSFFESYDVSSGVPLRRAKLSGVNAWAAYALAFYADAEKQEKMLTATKKCCQWLAGLQDKNGGIFGGYDPSGNPYLWKSTEHAIDVWFAFTRVGGFEKEATGVKQWLLNVAWNEMEKRFNRGENDPVIALDCQSWGAVWLVFQGDLDKAQQALAFAKSHLATQEMFGSRMIRGFPAQSLFPNVIWTEGTAQVVVSYVYTGGTAPWNYLTELISVQNDDGSWNHSSKNGSVPDVWHATIKSVAATCWAYFAIRAKSHGEYIPFGEP